MNRELTEKQKLLIKYKTENPGMSDRDAMRKAGYADVTVNNGRAVKSCSESMIKAYEKIGLTTDILSSKHKEWLKAKKYVKSAEAETTENDGKKVKIFKYDKETDDVASQIKAGEMITKIERDI